MPNTAHPRLLLLLLPLSVGGIVSCSFFKHDPPRVFNVEQGFIKQSQETPPSQKLLVIFVHGIFGGADTWVKGKNDSLPALLAFDPRFGTSLDVMVYQYDSPMLADAGRIPDVSEGLSEYLEKEGVWNKYKGIVFIGHSMGGLVIRQFLIAHHSLASKVRLIYLYATPTNGSEVAAVASKLSKNKQLDGMLPIEGDTYIDSVSINWTNTPELQSIPTYCSYEGYDTYGIRIVSQSSASALCTKSIQQLADHIDIVKPTSRDDPRYYVMQNRLINLIEASTPKPEVSIVETEETYRSPEIVGWGKNFSAPYTLCTPDKPTDWTIEAVTDFHLESTTERGNCNAFTTCGGNNTDTSAHVCRTVSVQGHDENRFDGYGRAIAVLKVKWKHPEVKK